MDGGAYCTLTPVVLSRGTLHAGGPYSCPNVRIRGRAMATNTPPNGAFRGFGAPQTEFAAEMQVNRIADALGISPLELRRRWVYRIGDETPTGQVLRESVAGEEVLERAAEAAEFERIRSADRASSARSAQGARSGTSAALTSPRGTHRARHRPRPRLARRRLHGQWRGPPRQRRQRGARPAPARSACSSARPRWARAPRRSSRSSPRSSWACRSTRCTWRRRTPRSCPTAARPWPSRTAMVVGGLVIQAAAAPASTVARPTGKPFAESYRDYAREHGGLRIDQQFEPYPDVDFDDDTYRGDAYPAFGWAAPWPRSTSTSTRARSTSAASSPPTTSATRSTRSSPRARWRAARSRPSATPRSRRSSWTTAATSTTASRRTSSPHRSTRRASPRSSSRSPSAARRTAPRASASCPWTCRAAAVVAAIHDATGVWIHELPATPGAHPGRRCTASSPRHCQASRTVTPRSPDPAPSASDAGAPDAALDPRAEHADPQPMRGPYDG